MDGLVLVHQPLGGPVGPVGSGGLVGSVELEVIPGGSLVDGQCRLDVTWGQCEVDGVVVGAEGGGSGKVDGLVTCDTSHRGGFHSMDVV